MILMYEDEKYYIEEYIEKLRESGFIVQILDNAKEFLQRAGENLKNIRLFIIDLMVFGPGNEFYGRNTNGGSNSGLILLDEIEKLEKSKTVSNHIPIIIFTNRKGPVFEEASRNRRVTRAIRKSDVLPSEFIKIVKEIVE